MGKDLSWAEPAASQDHWVHAKFQKGHNTSQKELGSNTRPAPATHVPLILHVRAQVDQQLLNTKILQLEGTPSLCPILGAPH